jgi:hypothetical protein
MNQIQQEAVAAGFIQALYESEEVRNSWVASQSDGWVGLGALIQQTLGLAQTPSAADLAAMRTYSESYEPASPTIVQVEDDRINSICIFNGANGPTND